MGDKELPDPDPEYQGAFLGRQGSEMTPGSSTGTL